jgi:hypothetical protein
MRNALRKNDEQLTQVGVVCAHCNSKGRMAVVSTHRAADRGRRARGETLWEILSCASCSQLTVRTGHSSPEDSDPFRWEVAFPESRRIPRCVPGDVARAYDAAMIMRTTDPKTYAVLLGTVLEMVCWDQGAWGQNLIYQLKDLASRSIIPASLADLGLGIRAFRSPTAQGRSTDLEPADLPVLEPLCEALILQIYVGPSLIAAAKRAATALT